ncbi:hypothetical protein [Nocardia sp. NPDC056000]|uniref:hypothetical protein n=1 Tax=Nocardia sp. NPDC056000 TaxID=3345674 RepID=UPI0035E31823
MNLDEFLNDTVTLFGLADNAMFGAVVVCGPNSHVYVEGLHEWSDDDRFKSVEITGVLVLEGDDMDLDSEEIPVHGLGRHYVVKDAQWELA